MSSSSVARPQPLANFSHLQACETRLLSQLLAQLTPTPQHWLEFSPINLPSPAWPASHANGTCQRVRFDAQHCCWPFEATLDHLPLADECAEAVLLRHLWQPAMGANATRVLLQEVARVLQPGGALLSISASPWHLSNWQSLGWQACRLPSKLALQHRHRRCGLTLHWSPLRRPRAGWARLHWVLAFKPQRPVVLRSRPGLRSPISAKANLATWCRAA